jgi:hypothetical protein
VTATGGRSNLKQCRIIHSWCACAGLHNNLVAPLDRRGVECHSFLDGIRTKKKQREKLSGRGSKGPAREVPVLDGPRGAETDRAGQDYELRGRVETVATSGDCHDFRHDSSRLPPRQIRYAATPPSCHHVNSCPCTLASKTRPHSRKKI